MLSAHRPAGAGPAGPDARAVRGRPRPDHAGGRDLRHAQDRAPGAARRALAPSLAATARLREPSLMAYAGQRSVTQWQAIPVATQGNPRHGGGVIDFDRDYGGARGPAASWRVGPADVVTGVAVETLRDARRGFENFIGTAARRDRRAAPRRDQHARPRRRLRAGRAARSAKRGPRRSACAAARCGCARATATSPTATTRARCATPTPTRWRGCAGGRAGA